MKFVLFSLFFLLCVSSYSQEKRYKFKCFKYQKVFKDKDGSFYTSSLYRDTSFIVVVDLNEKRVIFYGNTPSAFDLTKDGEKYDDVFETDWKWIKWVTSLDNTASRCTVRLCLYNGAEDKYKNMGILFIDYKDITYSYSIELDPNSK